MDQESGSNNLKRENRYRKSNSVALLLVTLLAIAIPSYISFFSGSLFEREKNSGRYSEYFRDDFDNYDQYSEILDRSPENLSRWQSKGSITAWSDVEDWRNIKRVDLKLTDAEGNFAILKGLENIQAPREDNQIKSDDQFPDYTFNCQQKLTKWKDFMLVDGRNLLFYEYSQPLGVDMSRIIKWQAYDQDKELKVYDIVIQDGLCAKVNNLDGAWYSPNGLPQFGIWWPDDGKLTMRNVTKKQYPSNGDHSRVLSSYKTPQNFILRTRFTVDSIGSRRNSYVRLGWDFDDQYDPGHDQTLIYASFEYSFLGLQRVYPIERYVSQGTEPDTGNQEAKTKLVFKAGKTYEIQAKVTGRKAQVEGYEIDGSKAKKVATVEYTFKKLRPVQSYPFSFETTGNIQVSLDEFEVWQKAK